VITIVGVDDVAHQADRRVPEVVLGVLPGQARVPVLPVRRVGVGGQRVAEPVDHRLGHDRGAEAIGLADDPRGEHAAAAAAGDEQVVGVDEAARDHRIDAADQVVVVLARVVLVDQVGELGAVARAAARVGVQHHVALRGVELDLRREVRAVGGEGAAVDLEQQRVALGQIEVGRVDDPALDVAAVEARREGDLLDAAELALGEQARSTGR
jgi:hypothetical protein